MADDFIERITREVDEQYFIDDGITLGQLKDLFHQALDELKESKIEMQDLQRKKWILPALVTAHEYEQELEKSKEDLESQLKKTEDQLAKAQKQLEKLQQDKEEYKRDCQQAEKKLEKVQNELEKQVEKGKINATKVVQLEIENEEL